MYTYSMTTHRVCGIVTSNRLMYNHLREAHPQTPLFFNGSADGWIVSDCVVDIYKNRTHRPPSPKTDTPRKPAPGGATAPSQQIAIVFSAISG